MHIRGYIVAAALTIAAFSGAANGQQADDPAETAALKNVSVTATDAIAAVEKLGTGKVVELTLETSGAAHYTITVIATDGTETNFVVDAKTAAVVEVGDTWADNGVGDGETMDDSPHGQEQSDGDGETTDDGPQAQSQDQGDGDGEAKD